MWVQQASPWIKRLILFVYTQIMDCIFKPKSTTENAQVSKQIFHHYCSMTTGQFCGKMLLVVLSLVFYIYWNTLVSEPNSQEPECIP